MTNALRLEHTGVRPISLPVTGVPRRAPLTAVGNAELLAVERLVIELKKLRRGRGVFTSQIGDRVGAGLRAAAGIRADDGPAELRVKVAQLLHRLSGGLPEDLRIAALAAFAIAPDARQPLYKDRVALTATRIQRDPRTARRRIDEAIVQLAQQATAHPTGAVLTGDHGAGPGGLGGDLSGGPGGGLGVAWTGGAWRHTELRVSVALDRVRPEVVENGQIRADQDQVTRLAFVADRIVTSPDGTQAGCVVDVLHGGVLTGRRGVGPDGRPGALTPGRPLAAGDTRDYAVRGVATGPIRPQAILTPDHPCDTFILIVRFNRAAPPTRVHLIGPTPAELDIDPAGEVRAEFHHPRPGHPHGMTWTP